MKNIFIASCLAFSLFFSEPIFSDPKVVGRASSDSSFMATNNYWPNWIVAGAAIAVAAVGLVIIANHSKHK